MSRKNLKIKLKNCSQNIGGLSHSKILGEQLEYFFMDAESAQDALVKFNLDNTSITAVSDASKTFYKIVLTKAQFGESDFTALSEFNDLLLRDEYSQIELKLSQVSDLLITDILLLSRLGLNLFTCIISNPISTVHRLLNSVCDRADSVILSSALLFQIDDNNTQWHPLSVLMNNYDENPTEMLKALIEKFIGKMTSNSIDCMLSLKDDFSHESDFIFKQHVSYFFQKIISGASQDFVNHMMVTLGLEFIISLISDNEMDSLVAKVSPAALRIALRKRNHEGQCGIMHAVEKLSQSSLKKIFEKLDPEWIDDLIRLLPSHALQMQARNALSDSHSQPRSTRPRNATLTFSTAERSLDDLLLEAQAANQDNVGLLQLIGEDSETGELKNTLLAINSARENHSILFSADEQHILRNKPIAQWSIEDCKIWADKIKTSSERLNKNYLPEMIAILTRGVELFADYKPRTAQLLSLLVLLQPNSKGRLAQIATGEGKSLIVAMLAMIKIIQGEKVDVVTSSPILAERDANDHQALYAIFNISVSHNWDKGTYHQGFKPCYNADVVYGSGHCFQADLLRTEYALENTRGNRPYQAAIVDEVDSMMIDGYGNTTQLSMPKPAMEYLNLLFVAVWQQLVRIDQKFNSIPFSDRKDETKALLKKYLLELLNSDCSELYIPAHFKALCLYQVDNWIKSAITARYVFRDGSDYVISTGDENRSIIAPVDRESTGVVQNNTLWDDGLHQFLQIKHNLCLQTESLMTCFISNHGYFKRYGNHIYGLTGTLGGKQSQALLQTVYPVDLVFMPTCRPKCFEETRGVLSATESQWLCDITVAVQSQVNSNRAVLLICESINAAKKIHAALRETGRIPPHKIKCYTRNDNDENAVIAQTMDVGSVLVATNLAARGTDLQITESLERQGGLHVCVTFLPENKRTEDQAFGRAARKGQRGTAQLIINKETTKRKLISRCLEDYTAEDSVEDYKKWRDVIETQHLQHIETFEFKKIALFDQLFSKYCVLRKSLLDANHTQFQLAECEDLWSLWLKKWMDRIHIDRIHREKRFDEDQIVHDYEKLAENITAHCVRCELDNPSQLLLSANKNFWKSGQASIEAYTKAIEKNQIASFQAYYNRAFACIKQKSGNYRADAIQDLQMAKKSLQEKVIPYLQSLFLLATLNTEQRESNTDLTRSIQLKINFYQWQIQNIDQAIHCIQSANSDSELDIHTSSQTDRMNSLPSQLRSELYQSGLFNLFGVHEIPKDNGGFFGALCVIGLGVLQIVAGVFIGVVSGFNPISRVFIDEGISDILYGARSMIAGNFSWDHYCATKSTRLAVAIASMGINILRGSASSLVERLDMAAIQSRVGSAIVRSGIQEAANFGIGKLTDGVIAQFKSDINNQVHAIVSRYLNQEDAKLAINQLFSADLVSGNNNHARRMRMLADEIIRSKQAVNQVAINILKGVVANQHAGLASAIKIADMAHSLEKIIHLTEDFCKDFLEEIKILAHSLPSLTQDHAVLRSELQNTLASYITKHIMAALQGEVVRPAANALLDGHVNRLSDRLLSIAQEEANHGAAVARPVNRAVIVRNRALQSQYRSFRERENPRERASKPDAVMRRFRNDMNSTVDRVDLLLRNPSHTPYTTSARNALQPRPTRLYNFSQRQSNQLEGQLLVNNELKKIFLSRLRDQIPDVSMFAEVSPGTENVRLYGVREAGRNYMTNVLRFVSDLIISPVEAAPLKETYPLCQRPYYEDAESAYLKVDGYGNFSSIGSLIGGKVQQNLESGIFKNACALRASYALFNSNEVQSQVHCEIPNLKSKNGAETVTGGDGRQYIFRLHKLIDFLTHVWGPPDYDSRKNDNKDQSNLNKKGVVVSLWPQSSSDGYTGHAEIRDDFSPSIDGLLGDALFWRLPSKKSEARQADSGTPFTSLLNNPTVVPASSIANRRHVMFFQVPIQENFHLRGDDRPPTTIHREGFRPRGTDMNLVHHLYNPEQSGFVSLTISRDVAETFPRREGRYTSYVYEVIPQRNAFEVSPHLPYLASEGRIDIDDARTFADELELVSPDRVRPRDIRGVITRLEVDATDGHAFREIMDRSDRFIPNPDYRSTPTGTTLFLLKGLGHVALGAGIFIDGMNLYIAHERDRESQNNDHRFFNQEIRRVVSAWTHAVALGNAGAATGAAACASGGPHLAAGCAVVGGIAGSALGYELGGRVVEEQGQQAAGLSF